MKQELKPQRITIEVPVGERDKGYLEKLREIAAREDRSVSYVALRIIKEYLKHEQ